MSANKLTIKLNNSPILDSPEYENFRDGLLSAMTIKTLDSKTTREAMEKGKVNASFVATSQKTGKDSDSFEVYEGEKLLAKYTRKNLMSRLSIILSWESWTGDIFTEKAEKTATVPQVTPAGI